MTNLRNTIEKENLYRKTIGKFSEPLEIILEPSYQIGLDLQTRNSCNGEKMNISEPQEVVHKPNNYSFEESENPLSQFQSQSMETSITKETSLNAELEDVIIVAAGEGKKPVSVHIDVYYEKMVHPHLVPTGNYG